MKKSVFLFALTLLALSSCTDNLDDSVFLFEEKPVLYALKIMEGTTSKGDKITSAISQESNPQTKLNNHEIQQ